MDRDTRTRGAGITPSRRRTQTIDNRRLAVCRRLPIGATARTTSGGSSRSRRSPAASETKSGFSHQIARAIQDSDSFFLAIVSGLETRATRIRMIGNPFASLRSQTKGPASRRTRPASARNYDRDRERSLMGATLFRPRPLKSAIGGVEVRGKPSNAPLTARAPEGEFVLRVWSLPLSESVENGSATQIA